MGTVYKRGTRAKPLYYLKFKERGVYRMVAAKGAIKLEDAKRALAEVETRVRQGLPAIPVSTRVSTMGPLLEEWAGSLTNRNAATDRPRIQKRIHPGLGKLDIDAVTLPVVMRWLDGLTAGGMSAESRRQALNLLSRFFGWAIARGLAAVNPVRMIPPGSRPPAATKTDVPWLEDDTLVPKLMAELGPVVGVMFYLGNRSGLRTGEICGLRVSDLAFLAEGLIRVRYSYNGPLKEDKRQIGKVKFVPAPVDAAELPYIKQRLAEAKGEDLVFPYVPPKRQNRRRTPTWTGYRKEHLEACWERASSALGVDLTWYRSTRHSCISRNLKGGASLDEVSAAVNHSSPNVTRRYYDHFVRRTYSDRLRQGLSEPVPTPENEATDQTEHKAPIPAGLTSSKRRG